jgi:hypothetical protein
MRMRSCAHIETAAGRLTGWLDMHLHTHTDPVFVRAGSPRNAPVILPPLPIRKEGKAVHYRCYTTSKDQLQGQQAANGAHQICAVPLHLLRWRQLPGQPLKQVGVLLQAITAQQYTLCCCTRVEQVEVIVQAIAPEIHVLQQCLWSSYVCYRQLRAEAKQATRHPSGSAHYVLGQQPKHAANLI